MNTATANVSFAAQGWSGAGDDDSHARATPIAPAPDDSDRLFQAEHEAQISAAVLDLIAKLAEARDLKHAGLTVVSELQEYFACDRVALGLCRSTQRNCRLIALSQLAQYDPRSEYVRAVESALDECVLKGERTDWPAPNDMKRHGTLACQKLAALAGAEKVVVIPLHGAPHQFPSPLAARGEGLGVRGNAGVPAPTQIIGALLFLGSSGLDRPKGFQAFLHVAERQLGQWIDLVRRVEPGVVRRQIRRMGQSMNAWRGRVAVASILIAASVLAWPLPYKIKCDCQVQPVTRRFVAAPFEGRLEKALVKQGDVVTEGQVLARLEGREIRWELAGLVAERNRAGKQRDTAMAAGKTADAQAAKLEMERLDLKIQLLEHRAANLEIRSPIGGVVISGDLERTEGAPLSIGQTLFEVAPLEKMVVEVAVPEDEILHVRDGLPVAIRFDAYPGRTSNATIASLHPRAEIRQSKNVFIAELSLENLDGQLRPGMNGRAKITTDRHALGWNLFHKPADWLARKLGW
jgi:biotin carboxyl carrier protein